METKFTKGEWIVYTSDDEWGRTGRDEIIIGMDSYNHDWSDHYCSHKVTINTKDEESLANAHLIAAAPDMYKAVEHIEELITVCSNEIELADRVASLSHELSELLKKARGE